jgi:hypothetical protein
MFNLRVDQNGGDCSRHDPAVGIDEIPDDDGCTPSEAYAAASCGDRIVVKGGAPYTTTWDFSAGKQKNCPDNRKSYITYTPSPGERVVLGAEGRTGFIALCDVDWIKFLGTRKGGSSDFSMRDSGTHSGAGFSMGSDTCEFGTSERVDHI